MSRIPDSLSCRVWTSFRSCSSSRWSGGICRASAAGRATGEQLVRGSSPGQTRSPGPAGSRYLGASGSAPSSPAPDSGASAPGQPAARSCSRGRDWGEQGSKVSRDPTRQNGLHSPASPHSFTQDTPAGCPVCTQPWALCRKRNQSGQTLPLGVPGWHHGQQPRAVAPRSPSPGSSPYKLCDYE